MGTKVEQREQRSLLRSPCSGMHLGAGGNDGGDDGVASPETGVSSGVWVPDADETWPDDALDLRFARFVDRCGSPVGSPTRCSSPSMFCV